MSFTWKTIVAGEKATQKNEIGDGEKEEKQSTYKFQ